MIAAQSRLRTRSRSILGETEPLHVGFLVGEKRLSILLPGQGHRKSIEAVTPLRELAGEDVRAGNLLHRPYPPPPGVSRRTTSSGFISIFRASLTGTPFTRKRPVFPFSPPSSPSAAWWTRLGIAFRSQGFPGAHAKANDLSVPSARAALAARAGTESLFLEHQGKRRFEDFHGNRCDARRITRGRRAVLRLARPHAARIVEEGAGVGDARCIPALDLYRPDRAGALGEHAIGDHRVKRLQDRKRNVHPHHVARVDRRRILRVHDRSLRRRDPNGKERAEVVGKVGIEAASDGEGAVGMSVVHDHVDAVDARPRASREVDPDLARVAVDGHRGLQGDHFSTRDVEDGDPVIRTRRELADRGARGVFRSAENLPRELVDVR